MHSVGFDATGLASGSYVLRVVADGVHARPGVEQDVVEKLWDWVEAHPGTEITVSLEDRSIVLADGDSGSMRLSRRDGRRAAIAASSTPQARTRGSRQATCCAPSFGR